MFKHIGKALRSAARTYAEPGAGVTVYSSPDSLLDFYRLDGALLPFTRRKENTGETKARRSVWAWGGGAPGGPSRLTPHRSGRHSTRTDG